MQQANKQSAVVFLQRSELPAREDVEAALCDLTGAVLTWHEEHELESTRALSVFIESQHIAVSIIAAPLPREMYAEPLNASGLEGEDRGRIENHGSHVRVISMKTQEIIEPADRMWMVYRIAARLADMDRGVILAPASGVFVMDLDIGYVDTRTDDNVPPMDLWIGVEMGKDGVARSVGAGVAGVPEVELGELGEMPPEEIYSSVMHALVYLRQIRRELVPGESLHIGYQPWLWEVKSGDADRIHLERTPIKLNVS